LEEGGQGVRVFLDSSVLLSACGSERSLSRLITEIANERKWALVSAAYCRAETAKNLGKFGSAAGKHWKSLQRKVVWTPNALTTRRPLLLAASKDKPVLISALAERCDLLLTLDKGDFGILLGTEVYGMKVLTPRDFLVSQGLG
jgi:predicted nucleic acid-binding protein